MNAIQIFNNPEFGDIRAVLIDNEPWFVGKDVAGILGYQNGSRDVNRHVDEEDRQKIMVFDGNQDKKTITINESGLYSLILSSKLPSAKKFKRWVTSEVLPSIRKNGQYEMGEPVIPTMRDYAKAADVLANCPADRLHYVAAVLRQGGFGVPDIPVKIPKPIDRRGTIREEERDRMQYESLLSCPQLIPDYPEAIEKHPELARFIPGGKPDNRPLQLQKSVSREGYTIGFDRQRMKWLMGKQKMTYRILAEKSGICTSTIRRYLTGRCKPGMINRNRICDAFQVEYGYFDI